MNSANSKNTHPRHSLRQAYEHFIGFFKSILAVEGVDYQGVIEEAKEDMVFRGHKAWILMFSIIIASVGLNANSIPVIIGAMLISPLMGPIIAIGLSLGTYDFDTLKRAFKNLIIAVTISLITSAIYFWLTPLKEAKSELLARTSPTILDVLVALFGGFAGIIALARRERSNVIPGVAIATALMPPLCTAGYGLATMQAKFFFGALYLFFINSVFISLATFITVKYLKFPKHKYLSAEVEKRIHRWITVITVIVILPSVFVFWKIIKESRFSVNAHQFLSEVVRPDSAEVLSTKFIFNDTAAVIELYFVGKPISEQEIYLWAKQLHNYHLASRNAGFFERLISPDTTYLKVFQPSTNHIDIEKELSKWQKSIAETWKSKLLEELYQKNLQIIADKDRRIQYLEQQLLKLKSDTIPIHQLFSEVKIYYPKVDQISYAKAVCISQEGQIDTIPTLIVRWKKGTNYWTKYHDKQKLSKWLKIRLSLDTVAVIEFR